MKLAGTILLVLLILLSIASGFAKVMLMPQELEFFGAAGMSDLGIRLFGAAQSAGAVLLAFSRTRLIGALVLAATFIASAVLIFMAGQTGFGVFSLLPVILLAVVVKLKPGA